jgi:hypothetical protein
MYACSVGAVPTTGDPGREEAQMDVLYSVPVKRTGALQAWRWLGPCPISGEDGTPHIGCEEQWYYDDRLPFFTTPERRALLEVLRYLRGEEE